MPMSTDHLKISCHTERLFVLFSNYFGNDLPRQALKESFVLVAKAHTVGLAHPVMATRTIRREYSMKTASAVIIMLRTLARSCCMRYHNISVCGLRHRHPLVITPKFFILAVHVLLTAADPPTFKKRKETTLF
jgi:hypothetical protein